MSKIISWILVNGATLLGVLQAIVKAIKELVTGVVNLLSLFMPQSAADASVTFLRGILNRIDGVIETVKGYLLRK